MLLTKLLTRSRFRDGDALGSISGLDWFEWFRLGLNLDISWDEDGKGGDEGEGEENGEGMFFMMPFTELTLPRLRREGEDSSSELKEMTGLEGPSSSGGRSAGDGSGEANGDVKVFTKLFTLSRFREGECSEGRSRLFESKEEVNGERTGERNGEGSGVDIKPTGEIFM